MSQVLVVCLGNICRSPMAAALLAERMPELSVASAGVVAMKGWSADPNAVKVMSERGVDISSHRARQLTGEMCSAADLILVMDKMQKSEVLRLSSVARGKVYELADEPVADPFRQGVSEFEDCARTIEAGVQEWSRRIAALF